MGQKEKTGHDSTLKTRLEWLLRSQGLGVLSTYGQGRPYASLVAFTANGDLKELIFATSRATRKYANLAAHPHVALLVDSRSNRDADIHEAMAATACGGVEEVPEKERAAYLERYLSKHPHLKDFVLAPSCALFRIRVNTYYLVQQFQKVFELHIKHGPRHPSP